MTGFLFAEALVRDVEDAVPYAGRRGRRPLQIWLFLLLSLVEREFAAAIELLIDAVLVGKLPRAHLPSLLFEVRGEPGHPGGLADLLPQGIDALFVLVAGEGQGGAEIVVAVVPGKPSSLRRKHSVHLAPPSGSCSRPLTRLS